MTGQGGMMIEDCSLNTFMMMMIVFPGLLFSTFSNLYMYRKSEAGLPVYIVHLKGKALPWCLETHVVESKRTLSQYFSKEL